MNLSLYLCSVSLTAYTIVSFPVPIQMDHTVGGGINKWHVRLLFHSEPYMKEEERKRKLSPPHLSRTLILISMLQNYGDNPVHEGF